MTCVLGSSFDFNFNGVDHHIDINENCVVIDNVQLNDFHCDITYANPFYLLSDEIVTITGNTINGVPMTYALTFNHNTDENGNDVYSVINFIQSR